LSLQHNHRVGTSRLHLGLLLNLLIGSIPGILFGTLIATRSPELFLRLMIAAVLLIVSVKLLAG